MYQEEADTLMLPRLLQPYKQLETASSEKHIQELNNILNAKDNHKKIL